MRIRHNYLRIKGARLLYDYSLKNNYMITKKAEQRLKILQFWRKYGLQASYDAYGVSRSTLYSWWKTYKESGNLTSSLNPKSQAPHKRNKRIINPKILAEIKRIRLKEHPNLGKSKLKIYLNEYCDKHGLNKISESTIARIIKDKKIYYHSQRYSHTGKVLKKPKKPKLRKPYDFVAKEAGDLVEIDTIVRHDWGVKRYIITAVDVKSRYAFAYEYKRHSSASARDFFKKLEESFPFHIKRVQTDNGTEFHKNFKEYLSKKGVTHYWNYKGKPSKNGHVERFNRSIQEEFINQRTVLLEDIEGFNDQLVDYLLWYNIKRPHWALGLKSPVQYLKNSNKLSRML